MPPETKRNEAAALALTAPFLAHNERDRLFFPSPFHLLICHYLFPSLLRLYNEEVGSATHHISTVSLHLSTVSTHCSPPRCHRESAVGEGNDLNPEEGRNNSPSVGVTEGFHLRCLQQWKQLCWIRVQHQQKPCQIHLSLYSPVINE